MHKRTTRLLVAASLLVAWLPFANAAKADDTKDACYSSYERAQLNRRTGDLLGAREALRVCSRSFCPAVVTSDCVAWLDEVERALPSIVVGAKVDQRDEVNVTVTVDGKVVTTRLDGQPIALNPGAHHFKLETPGYPAHEETAVLKAGEKNRSFEVRFGAPPPSAASTASASSTPSASSPSSTSPSEVPARRPVPASVYVGAGVTALALASFGYFALAGNAHKNDLTSSCAPFCGDSDVSSVTARYRVADISLGVAGAALATTLVLYFTRPSIPAASATSAFGVSPLPGGAVFSWGRPL